MASACRVVTTSICSIRPWWAPGPSISAAEDVDGLAAFRERIAAYLVKASREAKLRTSWTAPDAAYEAGLEDFVRRILDPRDGRAFMSDLLRVPVPDRRGRRPQRPVPDPAQADGTGRAGHVSGLRAVGSLPGRSRQPAAGRFRAAPRDAGPGRRSGGPCWRAGRTVGSSSTSWPAPWRCGARRRRCSAAATRRWRPPACMPSGWWPSRGRLRMPR